MACWEAYFNFLKSRDSVYDAYDKNLTPYVEVCILFSNKDDGMIREYVGVRQNEGERRRRWFEDDFFELIVWFESSGFIYGFQLCYDINGFQHALSWKVEGGFSHNEVDMGSKSGPRSDMLVPDGAFPYKRVIDQYLDRIDIKLDAGVKEILLFVYDKMLVYTNSGAVLE